MATATAETLLNAPIPLTPLPAPAPPEQVRSAAHTLTAAAEPRARPDVAGPHHGLQSDVADADTDTATESQYPTGFPFYATLLSQALGIVLIGFDNTVVATAVPAITNQFHTIDDVGWYSAAYRVSLCATQFFFGKLCKLYSPKWIFLGSIAILQLGSVLCATAASSATFVIGRAVAGLGAGGMLSGCFNISLLIQPLRRRPFFSSLLGAAESVAEISAPILGGLLTQTLGWRWCFYVTLPVGGIALFLVVFFLSVPPRRDELHWRAKVTQLDLPGTLLFVPALTCLFIALSWAGTKYAWTSVNILILFVAFVGLLALFAYRQYRQGDAAAIPPRLLRSRSVLFGFIFSSSCAGSLLIFTYYLPIYFQSVHQSSPSESGYMMLPTALFFLIGMLFQGSGTSIIGFYNPFMLLGSVLMPIAIGLMTTFKVSSPLIELLCYSGFSGFACGVGYQGPQVAMQTTLDPSDAPMALAVIIFAQHFGPALYVSIAQSIFTSRLTANLAKLSIGEGPTAIETMGLGDLQARFGPAKLAQVLAGLDESFIQTFYLAVGLACLTMVGSLGIKWGSVKKKRS